MEKKIDEKWKEKKGAEMAALGRGVMRRDDGTIFGLT